MSDKNLTPPVRPTSVGTRPGASLSYNAPASVTIDGTQELVAQVVQVVREAVVGTLGPNGRLVAIKNGTGVYVTKDGVTVARSIMFDDPRMEMVGRIITEAAVKTDEECGDGTTTTTLLTADLYQVFAVHQGYREHAFIERVVKRIIHFLEEATIRVTTQSPELYQLALTSSNNDVELSRLITDIYEASGDHFPEIEFREANSNRDIVQRTDGLPLSMEYSNPGYSASGQGEFNTLEQYVVIIVDDQLRNQDQNQIVDFFKKLIARLDDQQIDARQVLIVGRSIDNNVNSVILHINSLNHITASGRSYRFTCMQTHFGGSVGTSLMGDLAMVFDVPLINMLEDALTLDFKVNTESLTLGTGRSMLNNPSAETQVRIAQRVEAIRNQLETQEMSDRNSARTRFNESRIRSLNGQLVTVLVGGETLSEIKERKDRFIDVAKAVRSALVNGILPGVGSALMKATLKALEEIENDKTLNDDSADWRNFMFPIVNKLYDVATGPMVTLLGYTNGKVPTTLDSPVIVTNLTTGQEGTPEELGIYDTAYASITALKGGLRTAKILATLSCMLLGDKLNAVKVHG